MVMHPIQKLKIIQYLLHPYKIRYGQMDLKAVLNLIQEMEEIIIVGFGEMPMEMMMDQVVIQKV